MGVPAGANWVELQVAYKKHRDWRLFAKKYLTIPPPILYIRSQQANHSSPFIGDCHADQRSDPR